MAQRYYSISRGQTKKDVIDTSSSTAGASLEIRVDLAQVPADQGLMEVIRMLENVKMYLTQLKWPPA